VAVPVEVPVAVALQCMSLIKQSFRKATTSTLSRMSPRRPLKPSSAEARFHFSLGMERKKRHLCVVSHTLTTIKQFCKVSWITAQLSMRAEKSFQTLNSDRALALTSSKPRGMTAGSARVCASATTRS
jgi:hypothetical protein